MSRFTAALTHFLFLLISSSVLLGQGGITGHVNVTFRLQEQLPDNRRWVPGATVFVHDYGSHVTDHQGAFSIKVPIYRKRGVPAPLKLQVTSPNLAVLHPLDGIVELDTAELVITLEVVVVGPESDLQQELRTVRSRMQQLERSQALSRRQLNQLNKAMLDTIRSFTRHKAAMQAELKQLRQQQTVTSEALRQAEERLRAVEEDLRIRTLELYEALEEKFLRKQQHFNSIAAELEDYLIRVKDVRDMLPGIKNYFSVPGYGSNYNRVLEAYSDAFGVVNQHHQAHLLSVRRYWEDSALHSDLEKVYQLLIEQIHYQEIKPTTTALRISITDRRVKQTHQTAQAAHARLAPLLSQVEIEIREIIERLRLAM